jgi:hypothetical protein
MKTNQQPTGWGVKRPGTIIGNALLAADRPSLAVLVLLGIVVGLVVPVAVT